METFLILMCLTFTDFSNAKAEVFDGFKNMDQCRASIKKYALLGGTDYCVCYEEKVIPIN